MIRLLRSCSWGRHTSRLLLSSGFRLYRISNSQWMIVRFKTTKSHRNRPKSDKDYHFIESDWERSFPSFTASRPELSSQPDIKVTTDRQHRWMACTPDDLDASMPHCLKLFEDQSARREVLTPQAACDHEPPACSSHWTHGS